MVSDRPIRRAFVLNDTRPERHHGCSLVMKSLFRLAGEQDIQIIGTAPVRTDWRADPKILASIDRADLIIVNAEGTIHHDAPHGEILLLAGGYARLTGKPAALINATWEANSSRLADMARHFDIVSVRESASARALAHVGISCQVVPDFALGSLREYGDGQGRSGIAFSDNAVTERTLAQYDAMMRLGGQPLSLLYGRLGPRFAAASFRRYLRAGASPTQALQAVIHDRRSQYPDQDRFLVHLASRKAVVTGRFHMMIMCLATLTPFLAVPSNTHKIEAVIHDIGLPAARLPDLSTVDEDLLSGASTWGDGEADKIRAYVANGRADMRRLFSEIRNLTDDQVRSASRMGIGGA